MQKDILQDFAGSEFCRILMDITATFYPGQVSTKRRYNMTDCKTQHTSLFSSMTFIFRHIRLVGWSMFLILFTGFLTFAGYVEAIKLINGLTGHFFQIPPDTSGILGRLEGWGWIVMKYMFLLITRIISFYLAFLAAYCLTTPFYIFLSGSVEKIYNNGLKTHGAETVTLRVSMFFTDLYEGIKIGLVGILVTIIALAVNFIPVAGQFLVLVLYIFYSALMFIDYPASNRHWTLKKKINWVISHYSISVRIGILPAVISIIPVINIILMAVFFPLFTVYTTLNFIIVENNRNKMKNITNSFGTP